MKSFIKSNEQVLQLKKMFELGPPLIVLADALYFLIKPRNIISDAPGKLFGTPMYEKSSLFFSVVNGANYTLEISVWAFILWFIVPTIRHKASLFLPPFTVSLVWAAERFRDSILSSITGTFVVFILFLVSRIILQTIGTRYFDHKVIKYCILGSAQILMAGAGFFILNWIGYVD